MSIYDLAISLIPNYDPLRDAEGFHFEEERAKRYIDFIEECCTHVKGEWAGKPLLLEDWQKSIVGNIFGWVDEHGLRRYREVFFYIPRKNSKSITISAMGNALFFIDNEPGAEIYCAAAERDQASLIWNMSKQMILHEEELSSRCKIYNASRSITKEEDGSFYRPISADADTKHGFNAHAALIDELHVHKDSELFEVLQTSTGSRSQPLILSATTADHIRNSLCNDKLKYARDVQTGTIKDAHFLPIIYEASREDDWTSPEVWAKANPLYPTSPKHEYLHRECLKAQSSASYENVFKRLHLNIQTENSVRWIPMEKWDACAAPFNLDQLKNAKCFGGLDLSSTRDLSSLELYFPDYGVFLSKFYCPKDNLYEREKTDKVPYETWARQGFITPTEGNVIDYNFIRKDINDLFAIYDIKEIAYDPYNARQLAIQLNGEDGINMSEFRQGFLTMNEPCKAFEAAIFSEKINHLDHPILRWCAGNISVAIDASGNIKPDKRKSTERIDGIVAAIMAYGLSMLDENEEGGSIYDTRGILSL